MKNLFELPRLGTILTFVLILCLFIACRPEDNDEPVIPNYTQPFLGAWKIKKDFSFYTINIAREPGVSNSIIITNLDDEGFNTVAKVDGGTFVIPEQKFSSNFVDGSGSVRKDTLTVIFNTKLTPDFSFPTSHTAVGVR
ncbi:MAG TPA: hypothetical protein VF691_17840 [Cytophagaceae bacterium]|jgi:hypothetical protein